MKYGISVFYGGQLLVNNIQNYGNEDFNGGLEALFSGVERAIVLSFTSLYIYSCISVKHKINYRLLSTLFIVLPLLSLQRSSVASGIMFLVLTIYLNNRKAANISFVVGILFLMATGIGVRMIRENALMGEISSTENIGNTFIYGELSPVKAYVEIKVLTGEKGYQYGSTLFLPFLLKLVPRNWVPDKPLNSSAYYTTEFYPEHAGSGFFLAPSIFGDIYLNFGYLGCVFGSAILGFLFSKLDRLIIKNKFGSLPLYFIVYYNAYPLLRNNLSDSLFITLISYLLFLIASKLFSNHKK